MEFITNCITNQLTESAKAGQQSSRKSAPSNICKLNVYTIAIQNTNK